MRVLSPHNRLLVVFVDVHSANKPGEKKIHGLFIFFNMIGSLKVFKSIQVTFTLNKIQYFGAEAQESAD